MRRFAFLIIVIYCALPLLAEESPRLAVMEMTATGDYPDVDLRTRLTQELRQRIANELLFAVLDGPPQQERLAALPDNTPFTDRHACLAAACLPRLGESLGVKAVLWTTADCGDRSCFVSAVLTPVSGGRPTVMMSETPRDEQGLRAAVTAIAGKLGAPAPAPAFTKQKHGHPTAPQNTVSLPDQERAPEPAVRRTGPEKLMYQNYVFMIHAFAGTTVGGRLTLGTLRWEHFQMEIFTAGFGLDIVDGIAGFHYSVSFVSIGGKWAVSYSQNHELGFLFGVLGTGATFTRHDDRVELVPSRFFYRYNMDSGGVMETGISLPLIYFTADQSGDITLGIPNIQFYIGFGY
jgi:hypothetical protein